MDILVYGDGHRPLYSGWNGDSNDVQVYPKL